MSDYAELLKKYPTPFYVFDFDKVRNRVAEIKKCFPKNAKFCYAIKANPFLLHTLKDEDVLFEVCSEGELEICKKLSVDPEKIVFSGVMKNEAMIKKAVDYGVKTITLESLGHLKDLRAVLEDCNPPAENRPVVDRPSAENPPATDRPQNVIARLADGVHQFGMNAEDLKEAVKIISDDDRLSLSGIHFFTGTQKN